MKVQEALVERVRSLLTRHPGAVEKQMFGCAAFLIKGKLSVGVHGNELIVRLPPEEAEHARGEPGVRIFDLSGRPMKGWVLVGGTAIGSSDRLEQWVNRGVEFASSLPEKSRSARRGRT